MIHRVGGPSEVCVWGGSVGWEKPTSQWTHSAKYVGRRATETTSTASWSLFVSVGKWIRGTLEPPNVSWFFFSTRVVFCLFCDTQSPMFPSCSCVAGTLQKRLLVPTGWVTLALNSPSSHSCYYLPRKFSLPDTCCLNNSCFSFRFWFEIHFLEEVWPGLPELVLSF